MNRLEEAREAVGRICTLAAEGRADALEASAALLETAELEPFAAALEPELRRLGRLAGQAAAFWAHCLEPADPAPGYTARGDAAASPAAGQVRIEG